MGPGLFVWTWGRFTQGSLLVPSGLWLAPTQIQHGTALCLCGAVVTGAIGLDLYQADATSERPASYAVWMTMISDGLLMSHCFVLALTDVLSAGALGFFAVQHWDLAARNQTSLFPDEVEYDRGSAVGNLEVVFGPWSWCWVLPLRAGGPIIDGLSWQVPSTEAIGWKAKAS